MATKSQLIALGEGKTWVWMWGALLVIGPAVAFYLARDSSNMLADSVQWAEAIFLVVMIAGMVALKVAGPEYSRLFLGVITLCGLAFLVYLGISKLEDHGLKPGADVLSKANQIDSYLMSLRH